MFEKVKRIFRRKRNKDGEDLEKQLDFFLQHAEHIYYLFEKHTHQSQMQFVGETVSIAIRRHLYLEGTNFKKGEKHAELQSDESNVQDGEVVKEKENKGEGEPKKEYFPKIQTTD